MNFNMAKINKCADEKLKKELERLQKYSKYCLLDEGDILSYVAVFEKLGKMPQQLKEWMKIFDGGYLFSTTMFYSNVKNGEKRKVLTFEDVNSKKFRQENQIPKDIYCFAMTNYGNYICYANDEDLNVIYEWDSERCGLILKWDSFADWLKEVIDTAEKDLVDGYLVPIGK